MTHLTAQVATDAETHLLSLIANATAAERQDVQDFIDADEYPLALENIVGLILKYEVRMNARDSKLLLQLVTDLRVSSEVEDVERFQGRPLDAYLAE